MTLRFIDEIPLGEKRVFIRVDFNVPLTETGEVADDFRVRACLPTVQYALKKGAAVILASHMGRPKGDRVEKYSLAPVAQCLMSLLDLPKIVFPEHCVGDGVKKLSHEMKPGEVMLLENLRFDKGEENNEERFSKMLASLCDVYINDAFGTAHRAHASTVGMLAFVKTRGAGLLMKKELSFLNKIVTDPRRPLTALLGGAKVSDKIGVIEKLLNHVDSLCVGGAMAYTFLKAMGHNVGASKIDPDKVRLAKKILARAKTKDVPLWLPVDHRIARKIVPEETCAETEGPDIPEGLMGVDIGPKTEVLFGEQLGRGKTVFWNGPVGIYEMNNFAGGTRAMARKIAGLKAVTIIGGGDSVFAVRDLRLEDKITHISTGGGASLEFLEGKKLPGLKALEA